MALTDKLTAIGDAIREKESSTDLIPLADMPDRIRALSSGGGSGGGGDDVIRQSVKDLMDFTSVNNSTFTFTVPAGVRTIPSYMFYGKTWLEDVIYEDPTAVTSFGSNVFYNCSSLKATDDFFPPNLTTIGQNCFNGAGVRDGVSQFADVINIPASVTTVEYGALNNSGFKKIRFLGTPNSIDSAAMRYADRLTDIYVPWSEGAVANAPWGTDRKNSGAPATTIHYNTPADAVIE